MNEKKANLAAVSTFADHEVILPPNKLKKAVQKVKPEAKVDFDGSTAGIPAIDTDDDETKLAGPALTLRYDSLDNLFTPTRGTLSDTTVTFFD